MDFRVFCLFFAKTLELSLAHSIYRKGPPFNIISEASPKNYFFFSNSNEDIFCEKVLLRFFALIYDFAIKLSWMNSNPSPKIER